MSFELQNICHSNFRSPTTPLISIFASHKGLENCRKRHEECADLLHRGLQRLGLEFFVKNPVSLATQRFLTSCFLYSLNSACFLQKIVCCLRYLACFHCLNEALFWKIPGWPTAYCHWCHGAPWYQLETRGWLCHVQVSDLWSEVFVWVGAHKCSCHLKFIVSEKMACATSGEVAEETMWKHSSVIPCSDQLLHSPLGNILHSQISSLSVWDP